VLASTSAPCEIKLGADFLGLLQVLKLLQEGCWFRSMYRWGAQCSGSHQPSRQLALHRKHWSLHCN